MIGTAIVADDYPLYFDAVNEDGLCAAGLNFPGNAVYHSFDEK
jgi:choloylglycine hydrolase